MSFQIICYLCKSSAQKSCAYNIQLGYDTKFSVLSSVIWHSKPISMHNIILNLRFKHFNWSTSEKQNRAHQLVKALYEELKVNFCILNNIEDRNRKNNENNDDGDFFAS